MFLEEFAEEEDDPRECAKPPSFESLPTGQIGDYRILGELGRGGMGVVYVAEQSTLGRRVALKVLPGSGFKQEKRLLRFQREAQAAARLHHTNIVPVFEVALEGEHLFYAMQLIEGQGLDVVIQAMLEPPQTSGTPVLPHEKTNHMESSADCSFRLVERRSSSGTGILSPTDLSVEPTTEPRRSDREGIQASPCFETAARLCVQVADALAYAHARGIIHRDVKPSNLILDPEGIVWLTDFGLAKSEEEDDLTGPHEILGTTRYMSPERFRGKCDVRGDIYSLGLVLYELLVLRPAFTQTDRLELIRAMDHEEPMRPRSLNPGIPRDLETICLKCIEKDPDRWYQTALDVHGDLQRFLRGEFISARPLRPWERLWRWSKRYPGRVALILVSLLASFALIGLIISQVYQQDLTETNAELTASLERESELAGQLQGSLKPTNDAMQKAERMLYFRRIGLAWSDWEHGDVEQARRLLDACPEGHRHWEWHYLYQVFHPELAIIPLSGKPIKAVFAPDGESFLVGDQDGSIRRLNSAGEVLQQWNAQAGMLQDFAVHTEESQLISTGRNKIPDHTTYHFRIHNLDNGSLLADLSEPHPGPNQITLSADGHLLVTNARETIQIRDLKTGEILRTFSGNGSINTLSFSPKGDLLATAGYD